MKPHGIARLAASFPPLALIAPSSPAHAAERLANNADSSSALALFAVIGAISLGLAATRVAGHRAAMLATGVYCIAIAALLGLADGAGHFQRFKPPLTPLDFVKTGVLRLDAIAALLAGLMLIVIAARGQRHGAQSAALAARNEAARYGKVSRALHWSIALIFVALMPLGVFMAGLREGDAMREPLYIIHKSLGLTLLLLVVARIGWHVFSRPPVLSADLSPANRIAAKTAHSLLYLLMLGFPISGYFMSSYFGKVAPLYFLDLPQWVTPSKEHALPFGLLHKFALPILFYLVFAAHLAGVLKHHFLDGHKDAIRRISG